MPNRKANERKMKLLKITPKTRRTAIKKKLTIIDIYHCITVQQTSRSLQHQNWLIFRHLLVMLVEILAYSLDFLYLEGSSLSMILLQHNGAVWTFSNKFATIKILALNFGTKKEASRIYVIVLYVFIPLK